MSRISTLDERTLQELKRESGTVLLDFYADWCAPCRAQAPILERYAEEHPDLAVRKVDVDDHPQIASEFGVRGIPTLVVLRDGQEAGRKVGTIGASEIAQLVSNT